MKTILTSETKQFLAEARGKIAPLLEQLSPALKSCSEKREQCTRLEAEIKILDEADELSVDQINLLRTKRDS